MRLSLSTLSAGVLLVASMFSPVAGAQPAAPAAAPATPASGLVLYVATTGNDAWTGKLTEANADKTDGPFATLDRARDELRTLRSAGGLPPEGATVLLRAGTYSLAQPFVLSPQDSGTEQGPVTYAAFPGEKVAIKGSRPVTGWAPDRDKVFVADLTGVVLGKGPLRDLYWKGERQIPARAPNFDPQHPRSGGFAYVGGVVENESRTLLQYKPSQIDPAKWQTPTTARVHVWSWLNWNCSIVSIKSVDTAKNVITLASPASYKLIVGNRFFVENVFEELDAPGEWFCDEAAKKLYFWPPDGTNPDGAVSVPVLPGLILFKGDGATKEFVQYVHFRGFTLSECEAGVVAMSAAAYCSLVGCTITGCGTSARAPFGSAAISISDRSHHNRIAGCDIAHVGSSAIHVNEVRDWQHRLEDRISYNVIDNNHIHHIGEWGDAWGAIRVDPGCGGNVSHDNVISHNLVHDTPRQGISFNGFRNVIEYNHVHHTNQEQSDTGAIGMGARDIEERGSIIRYNYVHDTGGFNMVKPGVWDYPHYCWGIYLDDFTSGVHVYGNVVARTYRGGVMVHGGQDNVIENNIIVDGLSQQIEYAPIDEHPSGRTKENPAPGQMEWRMKGTRLVRNVFAYSEEKAFWVKGRRWEQILAESDRNLIWHGGKPAAINLDKTTPEESWAEWQKLGFDHNSVLADPLFVDAAKDDYRLKPESPAFQLGFEAIPVDKIGLYASDERASWPVADDCWREEHIRLPEGEAALAPQPRSTTPFIVPNAATPPTLDGVLQANEWPATPMPLKETPDRSPIGGVPCEAWLAHDNTALYVALRVPVSAAAKVKLGDTWGADDGAEICFRLADAGGKPGPTFVVQGFAGGASQSVTNAGAPSEAVKKLGAAIRFAAKVGEKEWVGEWAIPLNAAGIEIKPGVKLGFNLGVRRTEGDEWVVWAGALAANWQLDNAGFLTLE
ncbi:MAG: hypothetical protein A3K19_05310 [Lentisphaerae bacterium RIFOXYB12_FULL_65_16]|nr:MAG: hypothetical protein A3K18_02530 [Lentisphaerae bacterium RIFOXYA12_64_32]OGV84154.1 MAG: hypothetical protein A3K19_05310 [Lentisphaerae bacterium RIFOXYB12_FULL_65_16]